MPRKTQSDGVNRRGVVRMATGVAIGCGLASQKASAAPGQELVGSWTQTSEDEVARTLLTYTGDGGVVGTSSQHLDRSPSHGAWIRIGERTFLVTTSDMTVSIEERNTLLETSTVRTQIVVDEDGRRYRWQSIREDFAPDEETPIRSASASGVGRRIVPRPLD